MSVLSYIRDVLYDGPKAILYQPVYGPRAALEREIDVLQAHYDVNSPEYAAKIGATLLHYKHWRPRWQP